MKMARSTYYYRQKAARQKRDEELARKIEPIVLKRARYGYRRVAWQLKRDNGGKTVAN